MKTKTTLVFRGGGQPEAVHPEWKCTYKLKQCMGLIPGALRNECKYTWGLRNACGFLSHKVSNLLTYSPSHFKKAFTLAEVLITLGIIGIIAALTMPSLIAKYQKKVTAKRLEQTYSQIYQALNMAQSEHGDIKHWNIAAYVDFDASNPNQNKEITSAFVETYITPYLKLTSESEYNMLKNKGYTGYHAKDGRSYMSENRKIYITELANGVSLFWSYNGAGAVYYSTPIVFVDINGKSKPNVLGRDFFMFQVYPDKTSFLLPSGAGYDRDVLKQYCDENPDMADWINLYCTALIMTDNWEIKDDYPW